RRNICVALEPMATTSTPTPCSCHCWISVSVLRNRLELRPPHRPRSVDTTTKPTLRVVSRSTRNGCRKSLAVACATCAIRRRIIRAYGREACIRSCALRILEAETISSARVTLRMFCVDLILVLISRPLAMVPLGDRGPGSGDRCHTVNPCRSVCSWSRGLRGIGKPDRSLVPGPRSPVPALLPAAGLLELGHGRLEGGLGVVVPLAGLDDVGHQLAVILVHEGVQGLL